MQVKEETNYFTSFDGCRLFYRAWDRGGEAGLFIVHGLGEHSGRYLDLAAALSDLRCSIYAFDLRGHGRSDGARVFVDTFESFVKDLAAFREFVDGRGNGCFKQYVLMGQSMGGLIATLAALEDQKRWQALVLLSPFFGMPWGHKLVSALCSIFDLIVPRKIWDNPIPPIYLTHDRERLDEYRSDPLIQRRITIRLAKEMLRASESVYTRARELALPLAVLAAGDDKIVSTERARSFFDRAGSMPKILEVFGGFYHELLHEVDRSKPITVIKQYLTHMGL